MIEKNNINIFRLGDDVEISHQNSLNYINKKYNSLIGGLFYNDGERNDFINNIYNKECKEYKYIPAVIPLQNRIIVFGDIHGDYEYAIKLLLKAKVIDNNINWIGKNTYIVQVGDQIDRCRKVLDKNCYNDDNILLDGDENSDIKILNLFDELDRKAIPYGGRVISLLGNHELMNVQGIMDYVSKDGIDGFNTYQDKNNPNKKFNNGLEARKYAFSVGNQYARQLGCSRVSAIIIGSNLFVHAGFVNKIIDVLNIQGTTDIEDINIAMRKYLLNLTSDETNNNINKLLSDRDTSIFWNRILGVLPNNISDKDKCCHENISKVLNIFKIGKIIIGHTPQSLINDSGISSTCSNKVWRVDTGSSKAFNIFDKKYIRTGKINENREYQYLEILNDEKFIVY